MGGDQDFLAPIMSNPENVYQLGPNAYGKPATALNILRETIMGRELFDHAFKTYSRRWMFKHPTPEDFFRTMEDASAVDLDWFWRGWFYTTDYVDIGVSEVKKYNVTNNPGSEVEELLSGYGMTIDDLPPGYLFMNPEGIEGSDSDKDKIVENSVILKEYLDNNFTSDQLKGIKAPKYFYEVEFEKPGGLVMPLIVEYSYSDGTSEVVRYPAQVWRKNDLYVKKVIHTDKELIGVKVDPNLETADINLSNNSWPKKEASSDFERFKSNIKG